MSPIPRLSLRSLAALPLAMRPSYRPAELKPGIVHIGCGAFHRAHQAVYTEKALGADWGDWGIIGASMRQPAVRDELRAQDGLYTVLTKGPQQTNAQVIGCLRDVIFAPDDPMRLPRFIAKNEIRVVSLTVTEKGYCLDPATRTLNFSHPDIRHDLEQSNAPVSAAGVLVAALHARRLAHGRPLTILCCDNLAHNGHVLQDMVSAFARAVDADTASWIEANVTFPCTMVDRIVPATTPATLAEVHALLGMQDQAAVWGEPFSQWVIENNFATARPLWEAGGAEFVADVKPYEDMKLRLLNSSNSLLAYLGYLAGHEYIYEVMQEPVFASLVQRFMAEEAAPTLTMPAGVDLETYQGQVMKRFSNSNLPHRCYQIAMDGSQKLPQRLLNTVRDNLKAGRSVRLCGLAVAAWMRYVSGVDEAGKGFTVQDPLADQLRTAAQGDAASAVDRLLGVRAVFGDDLPRSAVFRDIVVQALNHLQRLGSRGTAAAWIGETA
jgi:fructuronate reductase